MYFVPWRRLRLILAASVTASVDLDDRRKMQEDESQVSHYNARVEKCCTYEEHKNIDENSGKIFAVCS